MVKNFLKVALRALVKNSVANTINILGLAIGIACFLGVVTVSYQAVSAARVNPAESISAE